LIYKKLSFTVSANLVDKKIGNQSIKNLVQNVGYKDNWEAFAKILPTDRHKVDKKTYNAYGTR